MVVDSLSMFLDQTLYELRTKQPTDLDGTFQEYLRDPAADVDIVSQPVLHGDAMAEFGTIIDNFTRQ